MLVMACAIGDIVTCGHGGGGGLTYVSGSEGYSFGASWDEFRVLSNFFNGMKESKIVTITDATTSAPLEILIYQTDFNDAGYNLLALNQNSRVVAPNTNQKQLTTLFEAQETVEKLGSSLMIPGAFVAGAGAHYLGGTLAVGAGCLDPTPVEPATCAVGIGVGVETYSVGTALLYGAYQSFKNVTIPTWKSIF
jgi:hypothetical protein